MQLKPIAAMLVLVLLVASLTVAGCTSKNTTESNRSISSAVSETPFNPSSSTAAAVASSEKAVDANGNGKMDNDDVTLLVQKYTDVYKTQVTPLIAKTGMAFDDNDNVTVKGDLSKLTDTEQQQLTNAIAQLHEISRQIEATSIQSARQK